MNHILKNMKYILLTSCFVEHLNRGCFSIKNEKHEIIIRLVAHLSSKACPNVFYVASTLQPTINVQILPKFDTWPSSFQMSPPTDGDIGLYFFPQHERYYFLAFS